MNLHRFSLDFTIFIDFELCHSVNVICCRFNRFNLIWRNIRHQVCFDYHINMFVDLTAISFAPSDQSKIRHLRLSHFD